MYLYKPATKIDCPSLGNLYQAREIKKQIWRSLKSLRQQYRECNSVMGHKSVLRLEILKTESAYNEAVRMERGALRAIEARANELGLTTIKTA